MKCIILIIMMSAGSIAFAQEVASTPPPAETQSVSKSDTKELLKGDKQVKMDIAAVMGKLKNIDFENHTIEILITEEGKDAAPRIFSYGHFTRLFASDKKVKRLRDIPAGANLQIFFRQKEGEEHKATRIIVDPPKKTNAPTQSDGTGD